MCNMPAWRGHGSKIVSRYVIRNALLPQITGLGLSLGLIFSGALITEIVFTYPGWVPCSTARSSMATTT
jgi:ABC-type dipeptide/oligopeptide/nickel transport system permease component